MENVIFNHKGLRLSSIERSAYGFISILVSVLVWGLGIGFVFSSVGRLRAAGMLLIIFSIDRLLNSRKGDRSIARDSLRIKKTKEINAADYFSRQTLVAMEKAAYRSMVYGGDPGARLAEYLIKNPDVREGFRRMGIPIKEMEEKIREAFGEVKRQVSKEEIISSYGKIGVAAFQTALKSGNDHVSPTDLFSVLSEFGGETITRIFMIFSVDSADLEKALVFGRFRKRFWRIKSMPATISGFTNRPYKMRHRVMNRSWTARPTPTLDMFSEDFTDLARVEKIGFLIGHESEYERLVEVIARPSKPNAILMGEPGSGRESIVAHLAFEIVKDRAPEALFDKRLVALRIGSLTSGATEEELTKRINTIASEIVSAGNIILYIEDIHNLVKSNGGEISAADVFLPIVRNDEFPVIGSTYPKEYKALIETRTEFADAFTVIPVAEISEEEAIKLLTYESIILEKRFHVEITFGAIKEAARLAHKYFRQKLLPSSAEDLIKESLSVASQKRKKYLEAGDMVEIAERRTQIPIHSASGSEAEGLLDLEGKIHKRLIDQEEAVSAVSRALREYRSGLSRKGGPIASFLFVGPTGVGKTELSKILAKIQFGSENAMLRFDMSEFQEKKSMARLIGSPDGGVAGTLTEAVIQKPFSLILLDEFEKAHPDILNVFLQVLDDGRLTDSMGRTVDFTNTIIIATSNAHSEFIKESLESGAPMSKIGDELKKKLTEYFRPELLNRFSDVIVFKTLSLEDTAKIAALQLADFTKTLEEAQSVSVKFEDTAVNRIAEIGFDTVFGARPLRAAISDNVRSIFAEKILKKEIISGDEIVVSYEEDKFKFKLKNRI